MRGQRGLGVVDVAHQLGGERFETIELLLAPQALHERDLCLFAKNEADADAWQTIITTTIERFPSLEKRYVGCEKFVAEYRAKYKDYPSVYAEHGYVAARCIHESLTAIDGNTQDKDKMRGAMLAMRFNAPRGPFRINPITQGPIHNIYIREVAEVDGKPLVTVKLWVEKQDGTKSSVGTAWAGQPSDKRSWIEGGKA